MQQMQQGYSVPSSRGMPPVHGVVGTPQYQAHANHQQYQGAIGHYGKMPDAQGVDVVNQDIIAQKRRRELERAVEEKETLLQTYRANRVDVHDTAILERHIAALRLQLQSAPQPVTHQSAVLPQQVSQMQVQAAPPTPAMFAAPSSAARSTQGSGPGGRRTKRDEVWERKYQQYLGRVASSRGSSVVQTPVPTPGGVGYQQQVQMQQHVQQHVQQQQQQHQQQQQQQQQQQVEQYQRQQMQYQMQEQQMQAPHSTPSSSSGLSAKRVSSQPRLLTGDLREHNRQQTEQVPQQQQQMQQQQHQAQQQQQQMQQQQHQAQQQQQQQQQQHQQQQQQQYNQQHAAQQEPAGAVKYGRRSTPESLSSLQGSLGPSQDAASRHSNAQSRAASSGSGFLNFGNDPKSGYGRRRQQY